MASFNNRLRRPITLHRQTRAPLFKDAKVRRLWYRNREMAVYRPGGSLEIATWRRRKLPAGK